MGVARSSGVAGPDASVVAPDTQAATRTLLELVAELMEESFRVLGEGHIVGTLPAYVERFGAGNGRFVAKHFLADADVRGPLGALSAMNVVSDVTGTEYDLEVGEGHVTKRLHSCEFAPAFEGRDDFPRAMMCMLHRAAYQGSVNASVPQDEGFDVHLARRILFGDSVCDFVVTPRSVADEGDRALPIAREPDADERDDLAYHFYTFLLTAFVDYLTHHLEPSVVQDLLRRVAARVGTKVERLFQATGVSDGGPTDMARRVLALGGRELAEGSLRVTSCPQAEHIRSTASGADEAERDAVRLNACRLCKNLVGGAVSRADPDAVVERHTCLAVGDPHCDFEVTERA